MKEYLREYLNNDKIIFEKKDNSFLIKILQIDNYRFEITIPNDIYEWFVALYKIDTNEEIWSDWSEWYVSGDVTKSNINEFYQKDIKNFIQKILSAESFQINQKSGIKIFKKEFLKSKGLSLKINNRGVNVEPGELQGNQ